MYCVFKFLNFVNVLSHKVTFKCVSSLGMKMCVFKSPAFVNVFPHGLHFMDLHLAWTCMSLFNVPDSLNAFSQMYTQKASLQYEFVDAS